MSFDHCDSPDESEGTPESFSIQLSRELQLNVESKFTLKCEWLMLYPFLTAEWKGPGFTCPRSQMGICPMAVPFLSSRGQ